MNEWNDQLPDEGGTPPPFVMVTTSAAVDISVREVEDERTPSDAVCLGTFYDGRLIARCVVPPEALSAVEDHALFDHPVHLGLLGFEEPPGLQCRLLAFVNADLLPEDPEDDDTEEPWQASVPKPDFETGPSGDGVGLGEPEGTVPILLGHIVRMSADRKHPEDLAHEAMDVLATILTGSVTEVVDRVLEDLLGPTSTEPGEPGTAAPDETEGNEDDHEKGPDLSH